MIVLTPWIFGTTDPPTVWVMNVIAFVLGGLLLAKWAVRTAIRLVRAEEERPGPESLSITLTGEEGAEGRNWGRWITRALALLTVLVLAYTLTSALNARATYLGDQLFEYHEPIEWLPHSYDSRQTWFAFWTYLAWACFFWAVRDWLLGAAKHRAGVSNEREHRTSGPALKGAGRLHSSSEPGRRPHRENLLPPRLNRLLWVLSINGALLGLEAILQRLDGTNKLLWMVEPLFNKTALSQFGPYAYRSNAAGYFNAIWPLCLGFWLVHRRAAYHARTSVRVGASNHLVLLPCAVVMAACPIISTSRGGAFVSVGLMLMSMPVVLYSTRRDSWIVRSGILFFFLIVLLFGGYLGWRQLEVRLSTLFTDQMSQRPEIYQNAKEIAEEFPLFGTGPGTFSSIYQLYRQPEQKWHATVHDDWLELRIMFGWLGMSLILTMLLLVLVRWFARRGLLAPWDFVAMIWISVFGFLVHAKFDFPFQVYSLALVFVLMCSVLSAVSRRP